MSLSFLAFPDYQLSSNGPFSKIFTAWREKTWVFLHEPQQRSDLKFADKLLKMKSTTSQTVFHVTRRVAYNLFSLRAQRDTFPPED